MYLLFIFILSTVSVFPCFSVSVHLDFSVSVFCVLRSRVWFPGVPTWDFYILRVDLGGVFWFRIHFVSLHFWFRILYFTSAFYIRLLLGLNYWLLLLVIYYHWLMMYLSLFVQVETHKATPVSSLHTPAYVSSPFDTQTSNPMYYDI